MSRKQLARSGGDLGRLGTDDSQCTILHLDMDSFFVSVELLERRDLVGLPVIVGGRAGRGVVVSASYEAREFGVHAAMPMSRAIRQCPQAVVIPPSRGKYSYYSEIVFELVSQVTSEVAKVSVDEAYIDVTSARRRLGSPAQIAWNLRQTIFARTGLQASVGIAATMVVAKMASARAKPNGQLVVAPGDVARFLGPMPVEALPGVGASTQRTLGRYGIRRIGQLAQADPAWAARILGSHGATLSGYARGVDERTVHDRARDHSISAEHTFDQDVYVLAELERELLRLADGVAQRLRAQGKVAGSVGVKYRTGEFKTVSRQATLAVPSDVAAELHTAVLPALRALHEHNRMGVRLLGLRTADLQDAARTGRQEALDLDSGDGPAPAWQHSPGPQRSRRRGGRDSEAEHQAQLALDSVRERFGKAAISPASLLQREGEDDHRRSDGT